MLEYVYYCPRRNQLLVFPVYPRFWLDEFEVDGLKGKVLMMNMIYLGGL